MGIDIAAFEFLLRAHEELGDFGPTLTLGRQRLLIRNDAEQAAYARVLSKYRPDLTIKDISHDYVDQLISCLGGQPCHFMDNSEYEGAQVIHDLNTPISPAAVASYNTVIDIGTLEHVFNVGVAFKSVGEIVKAGGNFLSLTVADNHLGHGFWQLGPEAYFRTFSEDHGYEPRLADLYYKGQFHALRDPADAGRRLPISTPGYTYLTFAARRLSDTPLFQNGWPVQADYAAAWSIFLARRAAAAGKTDDAISQLQDCIRRNPKNPIYLSELAQIRRNAGGAGALDEANALSAKAYEMAPDNPQVVAERNRVLKQLGLAEIPLATNVTVAAQPKSSGQKASAAAAAGKPKAHKVVDAVRSALSKASTVFDRDASPKNNVAPPQADTVVDPPRIRIGPISAALNDERIPENARDALRRGRYEFKEREIARRLLAKGDRVIELGAGMGVVSATMATIIGPEGKLLSFEANPEIIKLAAENANANGLAIQFRNAIANPRSITPPGSTIDFYVLKSFAASSTRQASRAQKPIKIPAMPMEDQIAAHNANALVFDIEGSERDVIMHGDFSGIEKIIFEIHPKIIGLPVCVELIQKLESHGLNLRRDLMFGDVIAFDRAPATGAAEAGKLFSDLLDFEEAVRNVDYKSALAMGETLGSEMSENGYFWHRIASMKRHLKKDALADAERAARLGCEDFLLYADLSVMLCEHARYPDARQAVDKLRTLYDRSPVIDVVEKRLAAHVS